MGISDACARDGRFITKDLHSSLFRANLVAYTSAFALCSQSCPTLSSHLFRGQPLDLTTSIRPCRAMYGCIFCPMRLTCPKYHRRLICSLCWRSVSFEAEIDITCKLPWFCLCRLCSLLINFKLYLVPKPPPLPLPPNCFYLRHPGPGPATGTQDRLTAGCKYVCDLFNLTFRPGWIILQTSDDSLFSSSRIFV